MQMHLYKDEAHMQSVMSSDLCCWLVFISVCVFVRVFVEELEQKRLGWRRRSVKLGNRGGVGVSTAAGFHAEDKSLRLEPGVMTTSSSVLPKALHSLLREKIHFFN